MVKNNALISLAFHILLIVVVLLLLRYFSLRMCALRDVCTYIHVCVHRTAIVYVTFRVGGKANDGLLTVAFLTQLKLIALQNSITGKVH